MNSGPKIALSTCDLMTTKQSKEWSTLLIRMSHPDLRARKQSIVAIETHKGTSSMKPMHQSASVAEAQDLRLGSKIIESSTFGD
ncbi:hypothetical protein GOBAR_AA01539 [Gossypium barbadense]|uniref:Uncharacterized protein n=1 Tax=Gossypium barbadense TaxID=3634 RepID=A0A2P5YTY7_GOSBA|nr:hypothetical protein GOBAR_AA01539 [Gossypium barbadense]